MNNALTNISESINIALANKVREKVAAGIKIIQLQTGDPDFSTPLPIINAMFNSMINGNTHYCTSSGLAQLKNEITQKLIKENALANAHPNRVTITHGAVQAIHLALASTLNRGDEVIVIAPYWLAYQTNVAFLGADLKVLNTTKSTHFEPDITQLRNLISNKTKAIIINSPNNPTGAVYSRATLNAIAKVCVEHNLYIISDEVYEALTYQVKHHSIQALVPNYEKVISVFSFSKSYAMTGWRLGYMYTSLALATQINKLIQYQSTCLNPATQIAALCALTHSDVANELAHHYSTYQKRRDLVLDLVQGSWLEKAINIPQGAFYFWVDISQFNISAPRFCEGLLDKYGLSVTPGNAFSNDYDDFIRFTFAVCERDLISALNILKKMEP